MSARGHHVWTKSCAWLLPAALAACNAIMGAERAELVQPQDSGAAGSSAGSGGEGGEDASAGGGGETGTATDGGGACWSASDLGVLGDAGAFGIMTASESCVYSAGLDEPALQDCIAQKTGLSDACAHCFDQGIHCTVTSCSMCLTAPAGADCTNCRTTNCDPTMHSCAGV